MVLIKPYNARYNFSYIRLVYASVVCRLTGALAFMLPPLDQEPHS